MSLTVQKIAASVIAVLAFLVAMNLIIDPLFPGTEPEKKEAKTGYAAASSNGPAMAPAAAAAPLRPLAERLASANADKGKATTAKCASCHTFTEGGPTRVGPNLYGVFGRPKGSVAGFSYSSGMQSAGGSWTSDDLDKFLTKPSAFVAGTKMTFAGLPDGDQRADVIAYLKTLGGKGN